MGAFASIVRGALAGLNERAGNTQVASDLEAANQRARDERTAKLRAQLVPHALAIRGLQQKAQGLDPTKDATQLAGIQSEIEQNLQAVRGILQPEKNPQGNVFERGITDRLHLTSQQGRINKEAAHRAAGAGEDEASARALLQASPSYTETPGYKKDVDLLNRKTESEIRVAEVRLANAGWTKAGNPVEADDGTGNKVWMQPFTNKMGETMMQPMPPGYVGPNVKPTKGTLVRSAQSPTGFAQTWVDPMNPSKIVGWQPITPSRYYQGTTTSSTSTDPFGVKTSSQHVTQPLNQQEVDLSGAMQLPGEPEPATAAPGVAPAAAPTSHAPITSGHRQLAATRQTQTGGGKTLDAEGHIPANATANPQLIQAANSILDGMDVNKLPIPQRDRAAAMQLATEYGWKGQGLFTPREVLQLKEGANVIQQMLNSKSLDVLDQGTISQLPMLGQGADPSKENFFGRLATKLSSSAASPEQQEFLRQWRQLDALAVGLRALVQTGRATQAQVDRIVAEFPNPYNTTSADDARARLKRVQNELQIAAETGKLPDVETGHGASSPAAGVIVVSPEDMR